MNSSTFDSQRHDSLKRRWQERRSLTAINTRFVNGATIPPSSLPFKANPFNKLQTFPGLDDDDLVSTVVPPVTVVLEGRSICQRISLHKHASYHSLAKALRQMFVDGSDATVTSENDLDLSNAVPGHLIAYEDMENDLLLAGDLNWKCSIPRGHPDGKCIALPSGRLRFELGKMGERDLRDFVRVAKRIRILPVKENSRKGRGGGTA